MILLRRIITAISLYTFFNPGPEKFVYTRNKLAITYQVKTNLGWLNIDRFEAPHLRQCGSELDYKAALLPGELMVLLFANRLGPDIVESRICLDNTCSDVFKSNIDLKAMLPALFGQKMD